MEIRKIMVLYAHMRFSLQLQHNKYSERCKCAKHAKKLRKGKVENCSFHIHFQFSKMFSSITSLNKIIAQLFPLDFRLCDTILD